MTSPSLPRISIVIPCFRAAPVLRRALESLFSQNYPDLEIWVVDGGSTDGTVEILRELAPRLAGWISEPDHGQADAINKGFARITGDVCNWLCADDELTPGSLHAVGAHFRDHPDTDWISGGCEMHYEREPDRNFVFHPRPDFPELMPAFNGIMQPATFWRRKVMRRVPPLDGSYHYALDAELWCRLKADGARARAVPGVLARFIQSGDNKTAAGGRKIGLELDRLYRAYSGDRVPLSLWYRHLRYPLELHLRRDRGPLRRALLGGFQLAWMAAFLPFYGYRRVRHMSWPA